MATPPVGAHIWGDDPLAEAAEVGADASSSSSPTRRAGRSRRRATTPRSCKASDVGIYVHAPYLINVCSPKPNVRYGSRKILKQTCEAAAEIGAMAVIVHPGHAEDGIDEGVGRWTRHARAGWSPTSRSTSRTRPAATTPSPAASTRWRCSGRQVEAADTDVEIGFCFDTCHAHAAGEDLADAVERAIAITGGIDLMHVNDSRDPAGTGADRHANIGKGDDRPRRAPPHDPGRERALGGRDAARARGPEGRRRVRAGGARQLDNQSLVT